MSINTSKENLSVLINEHTEAQDELEKQLGSTEGTFARQSCLLSIIHRRAQMPLTQGTGWLIALSSNKSHTEYTWP